jgi:hypothetical protein
VLAAFVCAVLISFEAGYLMHGDINESPIEPDVLDQADLHRSTQNADKRHRHVFTVKTLLDESQLVANALVQATSTPMEEKRSILLMYSFYAPNSEQDFWVSVENLRYFLQAGVSEDHPIVFLFLLIDGSDETQAWIPNMENVIVVHMDQQRADLCVYRTLLDHALEQRSDVLSSFEHFIFVNNGVRGPFVDESCTSTPWYHLMIDRLNDDTPIVGSTVSCETPYDRHVQSYSFAVTSAGLEFERARWKTLTERQCRGASVEAPNGGPWRDDGQCGGSFSGADGTRPAQCDPYSTEPVCDKGSGRCVDSMEECSGRKHGFARCPDYSFTNKMAIVHAGEIGPSVDIIKAGLNLASMQPEYVHTDFRSTTLRHPLCSNEPGHRNGNPMKVPLEPLALVFIKYGGEAWRHRYLHPETLFRVQELSSGLLLHHPTLGEGYKGYKGVDNLDGCRLIKLCGGPRIREDVLLGEYVRVREGEKQGHFSIDGGVKPVWRRGGLLLQFSRTQITPKKTVGQWIVRKGSMNDGLTDGRGAAVSTPTSTLTPLAKRPARIDSMAPSGGTLSWQVHNAGRYKDRHLTLHCLDGQ